jgi:hypothetical protein
MLLATLLKKLNAVGDSTKKCLTLLVTALQNFKQCRQYFKKNLSAVCNIAKKLKHCSRQHINIFIFNPNKNHFLTE